MKVTLPACWLTIALFAFITGCSQPVSVAQTTVQKPNQPQTTHNNTASSTPVVPVTTPASSTPMVPATTPASSTPVVPATTPASPIDQRVTLMAVGDIMVHQEQLEAAWDNKRKTYDFKPFFSKVSPLLQQADWVIGNLETTLSGSAARFTGYPQFNSPESLATTLKQVGFTAVTTANNHSLDRREPGVLSTISFLDRAGLKHTGTFRSAAERNQPLFLQKNGITLALLNYSYGTNGIPVPKGKSYLINLISPNQIERDIATARESGADLVAVSLHFGAEYQRQPNDTQKKIADLCIMYGADLIIGSHPHVVQPYQWRTVKLRDGKTRTGFVAYSLGNFISAQRRDYKDVGAILQLTILKKGSGETKLEKAEMIPTYVHYYRNNGKRNFVIYPLAQTVIAGSKSKDPLLTAEMYQYLNRLNREMAVHVSSLTMKKKAM